MRNYLKYLNEASSPRSFHAKLQEKLNIARHGSFGSPSKMLISKFIGQGTDSPSYDARAKMTRGVFSSSKFMIGKEESHSERATIKLPSLASPSKSHKSNKYGEWSSPIGGSQILLKTSPVSSSGALKNRLEGKYTTSSKTPISDSKAIRDSQVSLEHQTSVKSFRSNRLPEKSKDKEIRLKPSAFVIKSNKNIAKMNIESYLPRYKRNKPGEMLSKFAHSRK